MSPSPQLLTFIQGWEKCRLNCYNDSNGQPTIGWGHLILPEDDNPLTWTQDHADYVLSQDVQSHADGVAGLTRAIQLQQFQYDALVDFCYNKGLGNLQRSTLLRKVLARQFPEAGAEFSRWEGSPPSLGVLRRSCAEQAIFLCGDYSRRP